MELLSLSQRQVRYLVSQVKNKLKDIFSSRMIQLKYKKEELSILEKRIDELEEKVVYNKIDDQTYKKWFKRFMIQKSKLQADIEDLNKETETSWNKAEHLLSYLTDFPGLFMRANIYQKHSIIREVFKAGIAYVEGAFRTPYLNPALSHNELVLTEKGLLFVEHPLQNLNEITGCSEKGS